MSKRVLIIIPAYNESECIEGVIAELRRDTPQYDYVVINDCSTDNTKALLDSIGANYINLPTNLGIGGAVQTGYRYAVERGYDVAVQLDGDGQHVPAYLPAIVEPVLNGKCDMCIGSRFIEKQGFQTSAMRRFGINFLSLLIKITCGEHVGDVTSGFRACSKGLCAHFAHDYAQDYPEPEAIMSALCHGFKVKEAAVVMRERAGGKSSISPLKSVYYMIKVSLAIIIGRLTAGRSNK